MVFTYSFTIVSLLFIYYLDQFHWSYDQYWKHLYTNDCAITVTSAVVKLDFLVKRHGGVVSFRDSNKQFVDWTTGPGGWPSSPKVTNILNLTINQRSLTWRGVIWAGLQMCSWCVGLAHFPLSQIQRLMATGQRSATGSDKGQSAKFIWVPSVFSSILFPLPACYRGVGHTRLMDYWGWTRKSVAFFFTNLNRGRGMWW